MTHVKALHDELLKQSAKYKAAIAKGDKAGANTALKVSAVIREKLDKVAAEHMKAFSDFKEEIANDKKDGSTVTKMMTQMVVWKKQSDSLKRMSAPV